MMLAMVESIPQGLRIFMMRQELAERSTSSFRRGGSGGDHHTADETTIHAMLQNSRRRIALRELTRTESTMTVRELSERIATIESGTHPPPRDLRRSVYTTLVQSHFPALAKAGFVQYDDSRKTVQATDAAHELSQFTADVAGDDRWPSLIAGCTLALVVASLLILGWAWMMTGGLHLLVVLIALAVATLTAAHQFANERQPGSWRLGDR